MMGLLTGKTALVTGAARGIGKAIALKFAAEGANVAFTDLVIDENGQATEAEIATFGVKAKGYASNAADFAQTEEVVKQVKEDFGSIDILVNNAGIPGDMSKTSWETDMKDIKETADVNYFGTLAVTQALLPLIKANKGRIVNITVPSEISPYWHPLAYVASKAAQNAMMGVMAMEFEQNNIPVEIFSVHPGPTTTDLNGNMALPGFHTIDTVGEKFAKLINDGQSHNGEFIELYPIVKED